MTEAKKKILTISAKALLIIALGGLAFYYRDSIQTWSQPYYKRFLVNLNYQIKSWQPPCQQPITFSLGNIDSRFKLSDQQVVAVINKASAIWSQPFGQPLFAYATTSGDLTINFVYDYRQETTDKLKKLGIVVGNDRQAYDNLKAKYDALNRQYQIQKAEINKLSAEFDKQQSAYNAEVDKWNKRGGAPKEAFNSLNQTKAYLDSQLEIINNKTEQLNVLVANLNTEADGLNQLIASLNLNVDKYNTTGEATGQEFQEGVYIQDEAGRRIEVYEFTDQAQLTRLLAHELGHALDLNHSTGTTDIMYYLNEAGNDSLTPNDLSALQAHCQVNRK